MRAIEGKIDPPSTFNPQLDAATDAVVLRGLARDPEQRFATARDMALAIEQTIGLASPYEVGEWVESVAADEIARRARSIAEIESASMNASAPRIGLAPQPAEPPHSQVSSISVSRPAVSTPAPAKSRTRRARRSASTAALLAIAGVALGGFALQERLTGGAHKGAANEVAREAVRGFTIVKPPSSLAKARVAATTASIGGAGQADPPRHRAAPPPPPPRRHGEAAEAEPGMRSALHDRSRDGRKKYKLECLK